MRVDNQSTRNARAVRNGEITQEQARRLLNYRYYVEAKLDIGEMPFAYGDWLLMEATIAEFAGE